MNWPQAIARTEVTTSTRSHMGSLRWVTALQACTQSTPCCQASSRLVALTWNTRARDRRSLTEKNRVCAGQGPTDVFPAGSSCRHMLNWSWRVMAVWV